MRIRGKPALRGLALAIAVPLIPGLSCLAAGQPTAPACVPARCHAVPSRLRPALGGISPAEPDRVPFHVSASRSLDPGDASWFQPMARQDFTEAQETPSSRFVGRPTASA